MTFRVLMHNSCVVSDPLRIVLLRVVTHHSLQLKSEQKGVMTSATGSIGQLRL